MSLINTAGGAVHVGAGWALALATALASPATARAEEHFPNTQPRSPEPAGHEALENPTGERAWLLGGQVTASTFFLPGIRSPYDNRALSFGPGPAAGWSFVGTVLAGAQPWRGAVVVAQPEFADGTGVPNVSGVAGYIDGNLIRVAKVGTEPYLARLFFQQDIALGPAEKIEEEEPEGRFMPSGPFALRRDRPASRLEVTAGKFAATDFFDVATASSDPRHRFMNWSLMTNGAWDFAADTRGYTWGGVLALEQPRYAVRAGVAMMPTTPNGPVFDGDLRHARSEMVEGEYRYEVLGQAGAVKLLAFWNHARMGSYADALAAAASGKALTLAGVARVGASKYGAGLLVDQRLGPVAAFFRASWNDGHTETFAFTEIDRAVSVGAEIPTRGWGRRDDHLGVGLAVNGLSPEHVRYLQAGGQGFQLGDGHLDYAWETVLESYYGFRFSRSVELVGDVQGIANPGMNADRGPAVVFGLRLHAHI